MSSVLNTLIVTSISTDRVHFNNRSRGRLPLILLEVLEIAISRMGGNERFREFAPDILEYLIDMAVEF